MANVENEKFLTRAVCNGMHFVQENCHNLAKIFLSSSEM